MDIPTSHRVMVHLGLALSMLVAAGCSRAGGATDSQSRARAIRSAAETPEGTALSNDPASRLERFRTAGQFEELIEASLDAVNKNPDNLVLQILRIDALLAAGRNNEAEHAATGAALLATEQAAPAFAAQAIQLWTIARLRQAAPLDSSKLASVVRRQPGDEPTARMLCFWQQALAGRSPYRFAEPASPIAELPLASAAAQSLPYELAAVQATVNGNMLPLVFIDTGGQHTLMTTAAARASGVRLGDTSTQLTGFVGLSAQPGLIQTLELGSLVLHDVPVLVGDSPPLVAARGQMSLGTDLMHHVRFTIDYPSRRVVAQSANTPRDDDSPAVWSIPIWTFSQVCLARGLMRNGRAARLLVDTGDRAGAYISYRWGRRNLPQLEGPSASMVFRYKKRNLVIDSLELGTGSLTNWPVVDTIPPELDRLNLVDIMLGRDLLAPYQLTVDLPGRELALRPGAAASTATQDEGERRDLP